MQDTSLAARGQSSRNRGRPKGGSKGGTGKGRSRKSIAGSAAAMAGAKAGAAAASAAAYAAYGYNVSKGTWGRAQATGAGLMLLTACQQIASSAVLLILLVHYILRPRQ